MKLITNLFIKLGILKEDLDYHFIRAVMVVVFFFFGYQKWFQYEAQGLIPYISHGPLIFWMYPVFGVRGATYFLGVAEWRREIAQGERRAAGLSEGIDRRPSRRIRAEQIAEDWIS